MEQEELKNYKKSDEESDKFVPISDWAPEDKPREKLLHKGAEALTDAELLAILINTGTKGVSALDMAKSILKGVNNSLNDLGKLSVKDLMKTKGLKEKKAITIAASLELAKRRRIAEASVKEKITQSKDIYEYFHHLGDLHNEEFWVMFLNRNNKVIARERISQGGITGTVADTRLIMKIAVDKLSCNIALCHNHPSGNLTPSEEDKKLTKKIKQAGEVLDIALLDHIIVSDSGYFSFADEGIL